jgi:flavin reductase (DIM6/NTAB) family NADH-FMN oxidoreductase RutF
MTIGAEDFRRALATHAAGVVVVTAAPGGTPVGLTATSFSSVSLRPPLVSFYVAQSSTTWPALREAPTFGVNVLASHQKEVAARFARRGIDRFAETTWTPGPEGVPVLDEVAAHLHCRPRHTAEVGDHILVVGLVIAADVRAGRPLLYHQGRFGRFVPHV